MNDYFVYGGHLRSELEFPNLLSGRSERVDWTLRVAESGPSAKECRLRGVRDYGNGWIMRLYDSEAAGMRVEFGGAGTYDIEPRKGSRGWEIVWYPASDAIPELVGATVLGPILALTLQASGVLCLHGSAVIMDGEAVTFVAPAYDGTSTLAASLVADGAQLVADDVVAVDPAPEPRVRLGAQRFRVRQDLDGWMEPQVEILPHLARVPDSIPLGAIYVLEPQDWTSKRVVIRDPLETAVAVTELSLRAILRDRLVGAGVAVSQLRWIAQVVQRVPVYKLRIARDIEGLSESVDHLLNWHETRREPAFSVGS